MPPYPKPPKTKKHKRKLVSHRKALENLLDRLTSQIVIMRDKGCVTPNGCYGGLNCSHYYVRGCKKVRWDLVNCNCQCAGHNLRHNTYTSYYDAYMLEHYGVGVLRQLAYDASVKSYKWTIPELEAMVDEYQKIYQNLLVGGQTDQQDKIQ